MPCIQSPELTQSSSCKFLPSPGLIFHYSSSSCLHPCAWAFILAVASPPEPASSSRIHFLSWEGSHFKRYWSSAELLGAVRWPLMSRVMPGCVCVLLLSQDLKAPPLLGLLRASLYLSSPLAQGLLACSLSSSLPPDRCLGHSHHLLFAGIQSF